MCKLNTRWRWEATYIVESEAAIIVCYNFTSLELGTVSLIYS